MRSDAETALTLVLAHEGGYVNHPKDPGGATNRGVTQRVYTAWLKQQGRPNASVRTITEVEAREIYRVQYLSPIRYDELPPGLNYAVADFGVNSGTARAVKELQKLLGVKPDGVIGEVTLSKLKGFGVGSDIHELLDLIDRYCDRRMAFLRGLKTWGTFGKGWTRRVEGDMDGAQKGDHGVVDYAYAMAEGAAGGVLPPPRFIGALSGEENGKGTSEDIAASKTPEGLGVAAAVVASGTAALGPVLQQTADQLVPLQDAPVIGDTIKVIVATLGVCSAGLLLWSAVQNLQAKRAAG